MVTKTVGVDTFSVPFNKLDRSERNPRRTGREQGVPELAAQIASQGLLQALGVTAKLDEAGKPTGRYAVEFGGRRLDAIALLVKAKTISKTADISCRLLTPEQALEAGLMENVGRVAMHPADAFEAFAALHANGTGQTIEQIALRFGVTVHTVNQRLRLAAVSPTIMEAFRAGTLTLEQVIAYTVSHDHEAQDRVLAQLAPPGWLRSPPEPHPRASDRRRGRGV